ncbi:MAG: shikimate dehydrogenase [Gordonia sp. (in: high G+C Gram-positive bacteria)]
MDLDPPPLAAPAGGRHARRAAVLGMPVSHSRSPDLHLAAYRALGLADWDYARIECDAARLPDVVAGAGADHVGFSVTMPGKLAALAVADTRTDRAVLVGSANTLVRTADGWRADCTDIDGMTGALGELGLTQSAGAGHSGVGRSGAAAVLLGAGGTALPSVAAVAAAGFGALTVVARDEGRAAEVLRLAARLGLIVDFLPFVPGRAVSAAAAAAAVVISTVPAAAAAPLCESVAGAGALVDVIYDPWPTPLALAVAAAGGRVVGGLVMLLNQAYSQVEQFTGLRAPRAEMASALTIH